MQPTLQNYRHYCGRSFAEWDRKLDDGHTMTVAPNTVVARCGPDEIALFFYATAIIVYRRDGSFTVDVRGYNTQTTRSRLYPAMPHGWVAHLSGVHQSYIERRSTGEKHSLDVGGVTVNANGEVE